MAEGLDAAQRAGERGRVLFMLASHGIRRGHGNKGSEPCCVPAVSLLCPCSVPALYLLCTCSVPALYLLCTCSVPALSLLCPCSVPALSLLCPYCVCGSATHHRSMLPIAVHFSRPARCARAVVRRFCFNEVAKAVQHEHSSKQLFVVRLQVGRPHSLAARCGVLCAKR